MLCCERQEPATPPSGRNAPTEPYATLDLTRRMPKTNQYLWGLCAPAGQSRNRNVNFTCVIRLFAVCAEFRALLRSRRAILSSVISKRSKRENRYRLSSARFRHGVSPGSNRPVEPANQRTNRAFQNAQEGSSFAARTANDGSATTQFA